MRLAALSGVLLLALASPALALTPVQRQLLLTNPKLSAAAPTYAPQAVNFQPGTTFGTSSALTSTGTSVGGGDSGALSATQHLTVSYWLYGLTNDAVLGSGGNPNTLGFGDMLSNRGTVAASMTTSSITSLVLTVGTLASGTIKQGAAITGTSLSAPCNLGTNISGGSASGSTWNVVGTGCANTVSETITQHAASTSETIPGLNLTTDSNNGYVDYRVNAGDVSQYDSGPAGHGCQVITSASFLVPSGQWNHYLISVDTSVATSSSKNIAVYLNGVLQVGGCVASAYAAAAMPIAVNSPFGFDLTLPVGGDPKMGLSYADLFIDYTNSIVCTAADVVATTKTVNGQSYPCASADTIPSGLISKFISGSGASAKPVNLGVNGASPLGRTPQIFLTAGTAGSAVTNFTANSGTVTGLALAGTLYPAPYGPKGPPLAHQAVLRCAVSFKLTTLVGITTTSTDAAKCPIQGGDLLIAELALADGTTATGNHNPTCPTGFTTPTPGSGSNPQWNNGAVNDPTDVLVCYKIAGGSETGTYAFNWTTAATRWGAWALYDYFQVNQTTPIDGFAIKISGVGAGTTTLTAPSAPASFTLANSTDTLLSSWWGYDTSGPLSSFTAAENIIVTQVPPVATASSERNLASSNVTGSTATMAASSSGQVASIGINPQ